MIMVVTLAAFVLSPWVWQEPPSSIRPGAAEVPFFVILNIFESLALGLGVAFWWNLLPLVRRQKGEFKKETWILYVSVGWLLVNWWFHDGLHKVIGGDPRRLLLVEYGFHVSLILAGMAMVWALVRIWSQGRWWWAGDEME